MATPYYIISADQKGILETYGYTVYEFDGYYCVTDWYSAYSAIIAAFELTYDDEDPANDIPQESFDIMEAAVEYMFYSAESHTWSPAP